MLTYRKEIQEFYKIKEIMWCQRANSKWLKEGDANTSYFHRIANMRHMTNAVLSLSTSEGISISGEDFKNHIH